MWFPPKENCPAIPSLYREFHSALPSLKASNSRFKEAPAFEYMVSCDYATVPAQSRQVHFFSPQVTGDIETS